MTSLRLSFYESLRKWFMHPDHLALFGLLGLLFVFYPELFLVKVAPLTGDHLEQHFPWAYTLSQSLKQFKLPFWTPLIHCGFPLVAESQVGAFYIPNLLMYFFLPFYLAYSYMNLFHWFIAAWGTYKYAKQMELNAVAAFTAAVVFTFGTAYGGAYYNMVSLKTICWLPVALYFLERFLKKKQKRYFVGIGCVIAQSLVAGYLQMAVLTWFIFSLYVLLRCFRLLLKNATVFIGLLGACAIALVLAFPQIFLTFQLSILSNRLGVEEGYAYVGSLMPPALLTFLLPKLQGLFRGNCIYSGVFAICFVAATFFTADYAIKKIKRLWFWMAILSLLLALGQWSPLYVGLVKLTHFYAFRVPAKFIGFFNFFIALLAGLGVQVLLTELAGDIQKRKSFSRFWILTTGSLIGLLGILFVVLKYGRHLILQAGQYIVENFICGKPGHPRNLSSYMESLRNVVDNASAMLSMTDPWQVWAIVLITLTCVFVVLFAKRFNVNKLIFGALAVLLVDLYVFADVDIKTDFDTYQHALRVDPAVKALLAVKKEGALGRVYGYRRGDNGVLIPPAANMLYGIDDIGAYSPLVMKRYFETVGQFGCVNDSNQMLDPSPDFILERIPLLSALGVSHIFSTVALSHPDLKQVYFDQRASAWIYQNVSNHVKAYFMPLDRVEFLNWPDLKTRLMSPCFNPRATLLLESYERSRISEDILSSGNSAAVKIAMIKDEKDKAEWIVKTTGPGFFVVTDTMYPGWQANLNGRPCPILLAYGLFRAVFIKGTGDHHVIFSYVPWHFPRKEGESWE